MKRRLAAAVALSAAAALTVSACSSSGGGSGNGTTSLKVVAADYGTGPSNTTQKYWDTIVKDFQAANPKIKVSVQTINWNDFDNKVQTMVQNKQYPDVLEGDFFPDYAQAGLLWPAKDVLSSSTFNNLL